MTPTLFDGPPPLGLLILVSVAGLLLALLARWRRERRHSLRAAVKQGRSLRRRLISTVDLLETACDLAEHESRSGTPGAAMARCDALAFAHDVDAVLSELSKHVRLTVASLPPPGGGLPALLADEAMSLRLAGLIGTTRLMVRGLSHCSDLAQGLARLRASSEELVDLLDFAVAVTEAAEARGAS
jgi:hypothetical protein